MEDGTIIEHLDGHNDDSDEDYTLPPQYGSIKASEIKSNLE